MSYRDTINESELTYRMKETYLGVDVSPLTYEGILREVDERMERREPSTIIAVNPEKIMSAQRDKTVKTMINDATFQIPDGVGVLLASKLKGGNIRERVTGVDMMGKLIEHAAHKGYSVFFYGAKEETVRKAVQNFETKYPNLHVAGYANGYVQDEEALVEQIAASGAQIIFVALGSPKQELWIKRNMPKLPDVLVYQGVGGSFDVYAGTVKLAPDFYRNNGLEWLYRLISDPKRLKRQLNLPKFLLKLLLSK